MKEVYEVVDTGVDGWARYTVDFFSDYEIANIVKKEETSYGNGYINKHVVFDSLVERTAYKAQKKIENALSKLNEEEKKLLKISL